MNVIRLRSNPKGRGNRMFKLEIDDLDTLKQLIKFLFDLHDAKEFASQIDQLNESTSLLQEAVNKENQNDSR